MVTNTVANMGGDAKAAADKAAQAAADAAALAAAKTKETYDLVIPAQIDWSRTCWPQPMKDGIHMLQDGIATSVTTVSNGVASGVSMASDAASSGVNAVSSVGSGENFTPRAGGGVGAWSMPSLGKLSVSLENRTKEEVAKWLEDSKLPHLKPAFLKAEVDGAAMAGQVEMWNKNPIGFAEYAETHLGCRKDVSSDAQKLGHALTKLHSYDWPSSASHVVEESKAEEPKAVAAPTPAAAPAPTPAAAAPAPASDV